MRRFVFVLLAAVGCSSSSTPSISVFDVPKQDSLLEEKGPSEELDLWAPDGGFQKDVKDKGEAKEEKWVEEGETTVSDEGGGSIGEERLEEEELEVVYQDTALDEVSESPDGTSPLQGICGPCAEDKDCDEGLRCIALNYSQPVCLGPCGENSECPTDFLCEGVKTTLGETVPRCVPADKCPCSPALQGVTVPCQIKNAFGTCFGVERCEGEAWSACDAKVPSEEVCNGLDDDCDGETDEGQGTITCGVGICEHTVPKCKDGKEQTCDPFEGAQAEDLPDEEGIDSDCDGLDGTIALSVFVDGINGDDNNPGTMDAPLRSISAGILKASAEHKRDVIVATGTYSESLTLANGVSIHGGYRPAEGWRRYGGDRSVVNGAKVAIRAKGISAPTRLSQLIINSAPGANPSDNSIALFLVDSSSALKFEQCVIKAGDGSDGAPGLKGVDGANGGNGGDGERGCENDWGACGKCNQPRGGTGGSSTCGANGGNGGVPGLGNQNGQAGKPGYCNTPGGAGGSPNQPGGAGTSGQAGSDGANGAGGKVSFVVDENGVAYKSGAGLSGAHGSPGCGGGGGGGGGGHDDIFCDDYGGAGGGGGAGGCGGAPGSGGGPGGSSIAVVLLNSTPVFQYCVIFSGKGGSGGAGGAGGNGGNGGHGGQGGPGHEGSGPGGRGGDGGKGGRGGHGGGGAGGSSIGILCAGQGSPTLESTTIFPGSPGPGGWGPGEPGENGVAAETIGCGG